MSSASAPRHHPGPEILTAFASGHLGEGLALVVATHVALCFGCYRGLRMLEAAGGALLEKLEPAPTRADALFGALVRLDRPVPAAPATPTVARQGGGLEIDLPRPLAAYVGRKARARWRFVAPGIRHCEVMRQESSGGSVQLLRIAPGVSVTRHGHGGLEFTQVLRGAYTDGSACFAAGDFAEADADTRHCPVAAADSGCICVVATEAATRFETLIGRLLQPLVRI